MRKAAPPIVQISIVEGLPGSGKSLMLTEKAIEYMKAKRPVYTNLPLKFRTVRSWLYRRGGPAFANLIQPLTREHFIAFCQRQDLFAKFKAEARLRGIHQAAKVAKLFQAQHGPNIMHGPGANWIPAYAVIIIDECHHWFNAKDAMIRGEGRGETPFLQAYLTMHRHHSHDLWFATQDKMQVSVTVRRLAAEYWLVRDIAKEPLWMGLHFGMLGIRMLQYQRFNFFDYDSSTPEKCKPIDSYWVPPWLPSRSWLFRLYESQTHAGSRRELEAQLAMARTEAGVDDRLWTEPLPIDRKSMRYVLCVVLGLMLGGLFGYIIAKPPTVRNVAVHQPAAAAAAVKQETPAVPPGPAWKVTGTTKGAAFVGRTRVDRGGSYDGFMLEIVGSDGSTVWRRHSDGLRFVASRGSSPILTPEPGSPGVGRA